jgi:hypothetical protein
MSKKLLFKLDEVRHVLTERDILTNAKSEWLVRLFYSFQDEKSIYLAMVSRCIVSFGMKLTSYFRNMSLVEISELCSITLACLPTVMRDFILQRCSAPSTHSIS